MFTVVGRSGSLASLSRVVSQAGASAVVPAAPTVPPPPPQEKVNLPWARLMTKSLSTLLPESNVRITSGPCSPTSVRFAHTDIRIPNFDYYRRESTKDPEKKNLDTDAPRKNFSYVITGVATVTTFVGAKAAVTTMLGMMSANANVRALSKIEINLGKIPEGQSMTFKWRGKPLFVRHRTADEISKEQAEDHSKLRDPQPDSDRVKKPEWLIVLGICTHLGCVPIANAGEWGGYYCPCHGSHYDASGRIRQGPAPLNLEVPPYEFTEDLVVVVG